MRTVLVIVLLLIVGIALSSLVAFGTGGLRSSLLAMTGKIDQAIRSEFASGSTVGDAYRDAAQAPPVSVKVQAAPAEPGMVPEASFAGSEATLPQAQLLTAADLERLLRKSREEQSGAELWLQIFLNAAFAVVGAFLSPVMGLLIRR